MSGHAVGDGEAATSVHMATVGSERCAMELFSWLVMNAFKKKEKRKK